MSPQRASKTPGKGSDDVALPTEEKGKTSGKHMDLFPLQWVFSRYHIMLAHSYKGTRRNGGGGEGLRPLIYNDKLCTPLCTKKKFPKKATIKIQQLQEQQPDSGLWQSLPRRRAGEGFTWTHRRLHQCLQKKAETGCEAQAWCHRTRAHTLYMAHVLAVLLIFNSPCSSWGSQQASVLFFFFRTLFPFSWCGCCPSNLHGVQVSYL